MPMPGGGLHQILSTINHPVKPHLQFFTASLHKCIKLVLSLIKKYMLHRITTLFMMICFSVAHAQAQQNKRIDSLEKKIATALPDTNKANLLIDLAIQYVNTDSAKAIQNITNALKLSNQLKYLDGQIDAYNNLGIFYMTFNNMEKALSNYKEVEILVKKYNKESILTNLYSSMGNLYSDWNKSAEAIAFYSKAIEIGLKYNDKKSVGMAYNNLGTEYIQNGNLVKATEYLLKGIAIREEINDQKGVASISLNLSVLYKELKMYGDAITYGNNAITIYKSLGLPIEVGKVYVNFGLIANRQKNYPLAEKYFDDALNLFKGTTYTRGLAAVYSNRGLVLKNQNKIKEALANYQASYELSLSTKNKQAQAITLTELGDLAMMNKDYVASENYLLQSLKIAQEIQYLELEKDANETLANLYKEKGDYQNAYTYQIKFSSISDSMLAKDKIKIIEDVKGKYETEKKQLKINLLSKSDSIKSLQIENQRIDIIDNLLNISNQKLAISIADLQLKENGLTIKSKEETILQNKLDAQQKEQRIAQLSNEKRIKELELTKKNNAIIGISVFTLLLPLSGYLFYQRKQTQQKAKLQQEIFKQQDIAMQGILEAEEKERRRIASDLHDGVGQLMSAAWLNLKAFNEQATLSPEGQQLFDKSLVLVDESCKEVRSVSHNMMPNALLKKGLVNAVREFIQQISGNKLSINLQTDGLQNPIPNHVEMVLYRVIQESVNNVIKHAEADNLDISINQEPDGIDVMIEDNGKGFDAGKITSSDGIGLNNIKNRVQYLKGTVEWNTAPGNGTLVAIHIPIEA